MMDNSGRHPLVLPALVVGVLAISTAAILIKLCADAPAVVIAAARLGLATLILVPTATAIQGRKLWDIPRRHVKHLILAGVFMAAHFLFWITSLKHTSVLSSVVIVTTNPIFVGIASFLLFRERVGRRLVAAILVAGAGGALIALSDAGHESGSLYGDVLALGGAVMASSYFLVGRRVRGEVHFLSYITPVYAVSAVILVSVALLCGHSFTGYAPATYLYFVLLAVGPQLVGHSALNFSLRYVSATLVAIVVLGEPIGSTILACLLLGESVTPWQVAGGGLILAGIFLAVRNRPPVLPPEPGAPD
ncbi:MAG: DMT family transporter [Phycisphaerae bacterium]|nr:DMT family transporter [Phycisphaerae bacterium]